LVFDRLVGCAVALLGNGGLGHSPCVLAALDMVRTALVADPKRAAPFEGK
jgi:hypothetical protein